MSTAELLRYWPTEDDVAACIKTDAEASSEAVSLAVHQPMSFEVRAVAAGGVVRTLGACDEQQLLQAFLNEKLPEGRIILPIVGDSGVGKSHVVRWLDTQLQRLPDRDRRLVIRIPKGMSLKGVIGLILDNTPNEGFEKYRRELERAQESINPLRAAGQLCEDLAHTLHEMFEQAHDRLVENPADGSAREIEAFCRKEMLQAVLRNQYLRDAHFVRAAGPNSGPVRRLVEHLSESRVAGADDDRKHVFVDEDLRIADHIDVQQLGPAERQAVSSLDRPERRRTAVRILNEALDGAKQRLLRTDPAVSELFDAIRRDLLAANKELILLVEDFAVLSGLQRQLLQVVIKEAVRDGRQELCTMRTALAYTTGYPIPETVRTRAGVEYVIPNLPGEEQEILQRVERLVGAYLNAARLGQARLEDAYDKRRGQIVENAAWVPSFNAALEPDERASINAFGHSEDGYELFPFNRQAIQSLARETSGHADRIVYNPRFVILHVIYRLLGRRVDFARGEFPPLEFGRVKLSASMTNQVQQRVPRSEIERYLRVLAYWGGRPEELEDVWQVPERVFGAFGLDRALLVGDGSAAQRPIALDGQPGAGRQTSSATEIVSPPAATEPRGRGFEATLEQWRNGTKMSQAPARDLRKWVAVAVGRAIDWDWYLFRPQKGARIEDRKELIFVPNAAGNQDKDANSGMLAVCEEDALSNDIQSAQVIATLAAVYRIHEVHGGSLDYDGADEDFPRYAAFVERQVSRTQSWVVARPFRAEWDAVPALVQGLLIGARALGVHGADDDRDVAALVNALFAQVPEAPASVMPTAVGAPVAQSGLAEFRRMLRSCRGNDQQESLSWRGLLLDLVAARQGQGQKVHALDLLRLKSTIEDVRTNWEFSADVSARAAGAPVLDRLKSMFVELRRMSSSVEQERERLVQWRARILGWLGPDFAKDEIVRELRQTLDAAKTEGLTGDFDSSKLFKLLDDFRAAPVVTALDAVARLEASPHRGSILNVIGQQLETTVDLSAEVQKRFDELIESVSHEQKVHIQAVGDDPIVNASNALVQELERTIRIIGEVPG